MPISKGEKQTAKYKPESVIDEQTFNALCKIQCTKTEICDVLGVDEKTLVRWCKKKFGKNFKQVYENRRATGKVSLRRMQWKTAEEGNPTMQIWLGRNYLNQSEDGVIDQADDEHIPTTVIIQAYDASKPANQSNDSAG